jgi:quercetin dioxygenase-like cupin family protein
MAKGSHIRFDAVRLSELGNGFLGKNLVEREGLELTFVTGEKGAGHPPHVHEDIDEILIFLEGAAEFEMDGEPIDVKSGSMIYAPSGTAHGVSYKSKCKVIRIKW